MEMTFFRLNTDQSSIPIALENQFAGPILSSCWIIGGGPSLSNLPCDLIRESPIPKMCINLSGTKILHPTFWTSYDPSARFHKSVYLDPGVIKFVHRRRAMDLVPETSFKVCDCPSTFFFERDVQRGFADWFSPEKHGIVDWADSLVQAIEILYRLGFRRVYMAGCEMRVRPSREQRIKASEYGVRYSDWKCLAQFLSACEEVGLSAGDLDALEPGRHYHFDEFKPIKAAANTDSHYFRIAQALRLSRRSMSLAGLQLISVTPHSRLNDYFPYSPVRKVVRQILREVGDPRNEPERGQYRQMQTPNLWPLGPMQDYRPYHWSPDRHRDPNPYPSRTRDHVIQPELDGELLIEREGFEEVGGPEVCRKSSPAERLVKNLVQVQDNSNGIPEEG